MKQLILFIFVASLCLGSTLSAQQVENQKQAEGQSKAPETTPKKQKNKARARADAKKKALTPEERLARQAVLYEFVNEHHPALKQLLDLLEEKRPDEFRKAMRSLATQYDRLQRSKARDPERYAIGLELWKVHSRIDYASAQMTVDNTEKIEERLKVLLNKQWELKISLQRLEIDRQREKLDALRTSLTESRESKSETLEKQFTQTIAKAQKRSAALVKKMDEKAQPDNKDEIDDKIDDPKTAE